MRKLIAFFVLLVAAGIGYVWMTSAWASDESKLIALAFGMPGDNSIEMHAIVRFTMTRTEGRRLKPNGKLESWKDWIADHFDLRDETGVPVHLARNNYSAVIRAVDVGGTPEFFLVAKLRPGLNYTFDYIPRRAESKLFRYEFLAPEEEQKLRRLTFKTIETPGP